MLCGFPQIFGIWQAFLNNLRNKYELLRNEYLRNSDKIRPSTIRDENCKLLRFSLKNYEKSPTFVTKNCLVKF